MQSKAQKNSLSLLVKVTGIALVFAVNACGASFMGGGDSMGGGSANGKGFSGGAAQPSNGSTGTDANANNGGGVNGSGGGVDQIWGGVRQSVDVDYGTDTETLYVPADVYYDGRYSGSDALFDFYLQRVSPAQERVKRLITKAQGDKVNDQRRIEKVCRCGKPNKFWFFWEHISKTRRGVLHLGYNDVRLFGDWIVDNYVSDKRWYFGHIAQAQQGPATIFLGADTENPGALMGVNPMGQGYLRTWYYHPNSFLGATKEHVWDARDDMRIAISCDINMCPAELRAATSISIEHHFSHASTWKLP